MVIHKQAHLSQLILESCCSHIIHEKEKYSSLLIFCPKTEGTEKNGVMIYYVMKLMLV